MNRLGRQYGAAMVLAGVLAGWTCQGQAAGAITIRVIEGEGAANIVSARRTFRPIVEVRGPNAGPIAGAEVEFSLPKDGPRASYLDGGVISFVSTGEDGRAQAPEMRPLGEGTFRITASVERSGSRAFVAITQTNYPNESAALAAGIPGGADPASYKIQILEGDDGVNIVDKKTAVRTLVRVVDKNNLPVAAVPVVIAVVWAKGAGGSKFPDGATKITVITDSQGLASAPPIEPQFDGKFEVQVQANVNGMVVNRVIEQTNFPTQQAALGAGKTPGASAAAEGAGTNPSVSSAGEGGGSAGSESSSTSSTAATSAPAATSVPAAAGVGGAAAGGISGLGVLGIVGGGLLAAGGIAQVAGVGKKEETSQKDCSGGVGSFLTAAQAAANCVQSARDPATQCRTGLQSMLTSMGPICSCAGGIANSPAEVRSLYSQLQSLVTQLGLVLPSSCRP